MKYKWVLTVIVIASLSVWWYWSTGGFMELHGRLLVSQLEAGVILTDGNKGIPIFSIELGSKVKVEKYFEHNDYLELNFPRKRENEFICTAKKIKNNQFVILQVKNGKVIELIEFPTKIYYPVLINQDQDILFIAEEENQRAYLYKYKIAEKKHVKIYDNPVIAWSSPIISEDGSIIFAEFGGTGKSYSKIFTYSGRLIHLKPTREAIVLANGVFPVWRHEGKEFYYYDDNNKNLILYDILSNQKTIVRKDIKIQSQIIVSPDKKYVAFDEGRLIPLGDGFPQPHLIVMSANGMSKQDIRLDFQKFRGLRLCHSFGLDWVD